MSVSLRPSLLVALVAALWLSLPALADAADSADSAMAAAKAAGSIGEQVDGYLGAVPGAPAGTDALVARINAERRAYYANIAAKNGTASNIVARLAGKKLIQRTPPGQYTRSASGQWLKKP